MEQIIAAIYLSVVFTLGIVYLVYHIRKGIDREMAREKDQAVDKMEKLSELVADVVGKSKTVLIPIIPAKIEPVMSEDLECELPVETEPDVMPDEVEVKINRMETPDEEELEVYLDQSLDSPGELSQGLTYDQISRAIDVVEGRTSGENEEHRAGETFSLMPADFLNMICMQANHEVMVKKLIAGYVDHPGKMNARPVPVEDFNMDKYV